ncbi:MAG: cobalamin-dependent protein [Candidatus Omnitrophica bacterium]|nr:cobalamin-dependent protein [Candidatus Omnitrophota bacterium]
MKKVLLVNPPESGMGEHSSAPVGLLYIAGVLQKHDIPVKIVDGFLDGWKGIEEAVKGYQPGIIGITCHTYARARALRIAKSAKEILPEAIVVVGGAHPTVMAKQLLENYPFIDIAAIGEADYVLREVCENKDYSAIPGIAYRENGRVVINPRPDVIADLDSLPFPAWNLLDLKRYPSDGQGVYRGIDLAKEPRISVVFSRGCVGDCNFCSNRLMWKRWRHRSPGNMLGELELLNKTFGIKHIHFNDDCFSVNKKATIELCRGITDRKLNIVFDIVTRTDCVDAEVLQALKDAGCYRVCFGIETASPRLLKIMGKPINVKEQEEAIKLTNRSGIKTLALLIAGCVGETRDTINETIDFLNRAQPSAAGIANGLMIFPGTRIYEIAKKNGVIEDSFWLTDYAWKMYTFENSPLWLDIFSRALETRRRLSRLRIVNLVRNHRFVSRQIGRRIKSFLMICGLAKQKTAGGKYKVVR